MLIKKISRSGGSFVLSMPSNFLNSLNLTKGSYVTLELSNKRSIIIKPLESTLDSHRKGGK